MEETKRKKGRPATGDRYPVLIRAYDDEEGAELLGKVAQALGVSKAAAIRLLVREKAKQLGLTAGGDRG